ncbi:MAG: ATP-binding protein [Gemmataceae bacterium]|nr:ATP-binding protein [Gemmataceae bacterium]MDW8266829.1 ATP-binding protein [Gemmataceae bacterium]
MTSPDEGAGLASPEEGWHQTELHALSEMKPILDRLLTRMVELGWPENDRFAVRLAAEEAIVNGVRHGNRNDPAKAVQVRWCVGADQLWVEVLDEGPGFDPYHVPDPTAPENLERLGGRGVFLMRCYMDLVRYNDRGNGVAICKFRRPPLREPPGLPGKDESS